MVDACSWPFQCGRSERYQVWLGRWRPNFQLPSVSILQMFHILLPNSIKLILILSHRGIRTFGRGIVVPVALPSADKTETVGLEAISTNWWPVSWLSLVVGKVLMFFELNFLRKKLVGEIRLANSVDKAWGHDKLPSLRASPNMR